MLNAARHGAPPGKIAVGRKDQLRHRRWDRQKVESARSERGPARQTSDFRPGTCTLEAFGEPQRGTKVSAPPCAGSEESKGCLAGIAIASTGQKNALERDQAQTFPDTDQQRWLEFGRWLWPMRTAGMEADVVRRRQQMA